MMSVSHFEVKNQQIHDLDRVNVKSIFSNTCAKTSCTGSFGDNEKFYLEEPITYLETMNL